MSETIAFSRPSFQDLIDSALADLQRLPGANTMLRRSMLAVLAYMSAALASGEYDYLTWMIVNVLLPDSCTGTYLDRWGNIVGVARGGPVAAEGSVIFSGTVGTPIPAGTQVQTQNSQIVFQTTVAMNIGAGGTVDIPATAVVGGSDGNLLATTPMVLLQVIPNVNGTAAVDGNGTSGGIDAQDDDEYRPYVLQRLKAAPMGGCVYDYVTWAEQVAGVTRVWVYPTMNGAGTVGLTFTMDGRTDIIPLAADVSNVENNILLPQNAPVPMDDAKLSVFASASSPLAVSIQGLTVLTGYTLAQAQANVATGLAELFAGVTPGGYGWDGQVELYQTGGVLDLNQIYNAINGAAGVNTFTLLSPTANQVAALGVLIELQLPVNYS